MNRSAGRRHVKIITKKDGVETYGIPCTPSSQPAQRNSFADRPIAAAADVHIHKSFRALRVRAIHSSPERAVRRSRRALRRFVEVYLYVLVYVRVNVIYFVHAHAKPNEMHGPSVYSFFHYVRQIRFKERTTPTFSGISTAACKVYNYESRLIRRTASPPRSEKFAEEKFF
jgi:hypothetical protein